MSEQPVHVRAGESEIAVARAFQRSEYDVLVMEASRPEERKDEVVIDGERLEERLREHDRERVVDPRFAEVPRDVAVPATSIVLEKATEEPPPRPAVGRERELEALLERVGRPIPLAHGVPSAGDEHLRRMVERRAPFLDERDEPPTGIGDSELGERVVGRFARRARSILAAERERPVLARPRDERRIERGGGDIFGDVRASKSDEQEAGRQPLEAIAIAVTREALDELCDERPKRASP
jgi:hypothetical protein